MYDEYRVTSESIEGRLGAVKRVALQFIIEGMVRRNYDEACKVYDKDYTFNGKHRPWEDVVAWIEGLHARNPNFKFVIEDILAEDDRVALRWKLIGGGEDDRPLGYTGGTNILTVKDGRVVDNMQNGLFSPSWVEIAKHHFLHIQEGPPLE
ncbi:MAG: nuclear transport factor 2 family protein [Pseudomonadota bacterium]